MLLQKKFKKKMLKELKQVRLKISMNFMRDNKDFLILNFYA